MEKLEIIERLAKEIWNECYSDILSKEQIDYMLNKFLTVDAMKKYPNMHYVLIDEGFYAYEINSDHLFLSKLYLKKEFRGKKIAKKIINSLLEYKLPIILTVNKNNQAYYAYLKMGFKVIDSVISDIGNGYVMDDYIMKLDVINEKAYAKINLNLHVLGKRDDGYHELESLMLPIDLYDEIILISSQNLEYETSIENDIIIKAYNLMKEYFKIDEGVKIILNKKIPIGAGLAGGSACASAVIRGLNKLWKINASLDELARISLMIGSDTGFCMYNKPAIIKGRGDIIEFVTYEENRYLFLLNPKFMVSTKEIFDNYQNEKAENDLEPVTMRLYPQLKSIKEEFKKYNLDLKMSGSGPTLFAFSSNLALLNELKKIYTDYLIIITKIKS